MAEIALENVSKTYPDGTHAVMDLNLQIRDGSRMVLVGPSGCGKTTALLMVAGLEDVTEGTIRIGDRRVNELPPRARDIAMVFQNYALYPHMNVYDNMAFGLKMRNVDKDEIRRRVLDAATVLGIEDLLQKKPRQLSGGQRQRVAMGRAIVREPKAFLMDEPLSNLDAKLRVQMRAEIARIQQAVGVTTIYVTHDQTEAMTLGDDVAVMNKGVLQQVATPSSLYEGPRNMFVAGFIGSPSMNFVEAELKSRTDGTFVRFDETELCVDERVIFAHPELNAFEGRKIVLGIRPESMEDSALSTETRQGRRMRVVVELREDMGPEIYIHFSPNAPPSAIGKKQVADIRPENVSERSLIGDRSSFIARISNQSKARVGAEIDLSVDTAAMHFFDPSTGERI
jgi:multiple sugar transport system ATP-binding protein